MMKQPTEPTGNPLDYRCPACGLYPGRRCITSRGKAHKQRVEVANGTRRMVADDAPDPNGGFKEFIAQAVASQEAQARSRARKARLMGALH